MNKNTVLGIDIGGTNTKFGLVNEQGEILFQSSVRTTDFSTAGALFEQISHIICQEENVVLTGVGIGAPNANFARGTIEYAPNLSWQGVIPVTKIAVDIFNVPAAITNDANAAAVGEKLFGAAKDMVDFITITLGTGVGAGIFSNGQLITGYNGFAGELGHVTVIPNGRLHHSTGLRGSLESYCSATGIVLTAKEFLQSSTVASVLSDVPIEQLNSKIIFEAAENGDAVACKTIDFTAEILGLALANFALFSAPEAIILFGGVTKGGPVFIEKITSEMKKHLIIVFKDSIRIIKSELPESDAAILGAAALWWHHA